MDGLLVYLILITICAVGYIAFVLFIIIFKPKKVFCKNCKKWKGETQCMSIKKVISPITGDVEEETIWHNCTSLNKNLHCTSYEKK